MWGDLHLGRVVALTGVVALVAMFYQYEMPREAVVIDKVLAVKLHAHDLFQYIAEPKHLQEWFPAVRMVSPRDSRPVKVGKKYDCTLEFPLIGSIELYDLIVLSYRPHNMTITYYVNHPLQAKIELSVTRDDHANNNKLRLIVRSRRKGAIFQFFVSPVLSFIGGQQISMALFNLRSLLDG